jgi:hypothetical protein
MQDYYFGFDYFISYNFLINKFIALFLPEICWEKRCVPREN